MSKKTKELFELNSEVAWHWMGRSIQGIVKEVYFETVMKTIKGKAIKRNGTRENPAYLVESVAGNLALKLHTELEKSESTHPKPFKPKMFR